MARERTGRVDIAVSNAFTAVRPAPVTEVRDELWHRSLQANLTGALNVVRSAGRVMAEQGGGSIILLGSIAGTSGFRGNAAYSAAKGGLIGLDAAAAKDLGPYDVRVNLLLPSAATRATLAVVTEADMAKLTLLQRAGQPREIAQVICFLGSDRSSFLTGETINVDGGTHLNWGDTWT
jgi:NAD(P)-dependent dehydrogenase (short-subunit alcohol dehydrogenase family)